MKRAVKIVSFLFLMLLPGLFYEEPADCAEGVSIVEYPGEQQIQRSGGGVRLMEVSEERNQVGLSDSSTPLLNEGIDELSRSLMERIATKYFHGKNKPVTKIAIFDLTDHDGNITVGSRYISNRIRLAFWKPQPV